MDHIANMLTCIRNAQRAGHKDVSYPSSNLLKGILDVLKRGGYIRRYEEFEVRKNIHRLRIELKYAEGEPVIQILDRVSRSGRRIYTSAKDIKPFRGGLGMLVLLTSRGSLSDIEAKKMNVGGEIACRVF